MNIIDALVVTLGLDSRDLDQKQPGAVKKLADLEKAGDKTEKSVKKISSTSKETARNVEGLTRVVSTFLAVIGGTVAIKAFVQDFIDTNAALDRLSKNLGLSVDTISAWGNAAERVGGSAQGLQGTLDMLSKSQTQLMLTGESNLIPYFSALGVSLADVNGKARPVTDILLDLSDRFAKLPRPEANNLGRMIGIDQGTMNLLLQGRQALELEIKRQKEQTAVTAQQAAIAAKFQAQIVGLKQRFEALGRSVFMEAAPYLEQFIGLLERFGNWAQQHQQFIVDFLKVMAVGLAAIGITALPIDLAVVAVLALGTAIALLWDDYQTWAKGGKSAFNWGDFAEGIQTVADIVKALSGYFKEAYQWFEKLMNKGHENDKNWMGIPQNKNKGTTIDPITKQRVTTGPAVSGADLNHIKQLAHAVSLSTGIPEELIFSQWAHETGNFTNRGATQLNNLAGINVPGGKGQDYRKFDSMEDFARYYSHLFRAGGPYSAARGARTPEDFAAALKAGGYYSAPESDYAAGIRNMDKKYYGGSGYASALAGVPGAAALVQNAPAAAGGSTTSVDRSIKTDIGNFNVYTQATDADGMIRDVNRSADFLFASQANYGMTP